MDFHHDDQEITPETSCCGTTIIRSQCNFTSDTTNPALAYLRSLGSKRSRQNDEDLFNNRGKNDWLLFNKALPMGALRRHHDIQAIIATCYLMRIKHPPRLTLI